MRVAEVMRSPKVVTDWGKWSNDTMGKQVFPLSKRKGACLRYGASHRWRLIRFNALGRSFRLLVAYRQDVDEFKAHLAVEQDSDMTVLCSWEYHGTHPGWHMHVCCNDDSKITPGVFHAVGTMRLPAAKTRHRLLKYPGVGFVKMNDNAALTVTQERFRLDPEDLLSLKVIT
jgi:hypothetical protein